MEAEHIPVLYKVEWNGEQDKFVVVTIEKYLYGSMANETGLSLQAHTIQARVASTISVQVIDAVNVQPQKENWHFAVVDSLLKLKNLLHYIYLRLLPETSIENINTIVENELESIECGAFN